uniref:Secreted protein n=1 Tax=Plectus sambesii TaxID=2011161 RepID=A0A914WWZ9_9BILA
MASFLLRAVFLLCLLWGISDGRRLPRQAGVPKVQSRVVVVGTSGCNANGKEYKTGEEWTTGHLRYQCSEYGYNIIGCTLSSGKVLKVNEDFVSNNTAYRCYRVGNATRTYYQEFTCGVTGAPSCELKPITKETENQALGGFQPSNAQPVVFGQLPPGWKIVDDQGKPIEVKSGPAAGGTQTIISSTRVIADAGNAGSGVVGA